MYIRYSITSLRKALVIDDAGLRVNPKALCCPSSPSVANETGLVGSDMLAKIFVRVTCRLQQSSSKPPRLPAAGE